MFHILQITSTTLSALRCKQCLTIIFRQDNITDFISYDKELFGPLEPFKHHPKIQTEADYFVLQEEMSYYSTIKANYERSLIKNYHPFFKMHMLALTCAQCTLPLGYQVQTVNQNTLWLQNRLIIDVQNCAFIKDGKDEMNKLIKTLKTRLSRKLTHQTESNEEMDLIDQNGKRDVEKVKKIKQKEMIQKLERMQASQQEKDNKLKRKKRATSKRGNIKKINVTSDNNSKTLSPLQQKMQQSLPTTNVSSMNLMTSKQDTYQMHQSSFMSNNLKFEDQEEKRQKSVDGKNVDRLNDGKGESQYDRTNKLVDNYPLRNVNDYEDDLIRLKMTGEQRQQMILKMQSLSQSITKQSQFLQSHESITRILTALKKLSSQQKYIHNKVPSQLLTLNYLLTLIRKRFIEKTYHK